MRPYLAVIRDSFHEALVSRVLWILLGIVTLVLLLLVPLGISEQAGSVVTDDDFYNRQALVKKIIAAGGEDAPSPGKRIWDVSDERSRQALTDFAKETTENRRNFYPVISALQKAIRNPDLYREDAWSGITLLPEATAIELKGLKEVPADQAARFNRLALEAAFPDEIAPAASTQYQARYFWWDLGLPLPVDAKTLRPFINLLVANVMGTLLGVAGVFIAILVTASIIPQTFEAGSVDLLLSKPVSRGWLFLAKFVGGCAFTAINAAYFIGGLWLILGMRFDLWNPRLLWGIPLYVFLFAIYYGVSAVAGVIWRNTIVSVGMAIAFWFICFAMGVADGLVSSLSLGPRRIVSIVPAGDTLMSVNASNDVFRWDADTGDWRRIFVGRSENGRFNFGARFAGPVYDAKDKRIFAFRTGMAIFAQLQGAPKLLIGREADDWRRTEGINMPDGAHSLFVGPQYEILVAGSGGIARLEGDPTAKQPDINIFGMRVPLPHTGGQFVAISPKLQMRALASASLDPQSAAMALYDDRRLFVFARGENGAYTQSGEVQFDERRSGQVALARGQLFLAGADGQIERYDLREAAKGDITKGDTTKGDTTKGDTAQLELADPITNDIKSLAKVAIVSPDGHYLAVLYRDSQLWVYDLERREAVRHSFAGQGDISGIGFDGDKLLVADRVSRVTRYDLANGQSTATMQGSMPLAETIYRYALHPLFTIFPKPGELNNVVTAVLTDDTMPQFGPRSDEPDIPLPKTDIWSPILSNLAFLAVVLAIGCVYVYRKDF